MACGQVSLQNQIQGYPPKPNVFFVGETGDKSVLVAALQNISVAMKEGELKQTVFFKFILQL